MFIKISPPETLTTDTKYNISFSSTGGSADVAGHFRTLVGSFAPGSVTLSQNTSAWAYIAAFNPQDITFAPGVTEMAVNMQLQAVDQSGNSVGNPTTTSFKIRKPPIVLIHGYAANSRSWTPEYRAELAKSRGDDFIIAIDYGLGDSVGHDGEPSNTSDSLATLAFDLDGSLSEIELSNLFQQ